jgi:hypothetical protein
MRLTQTRNRTLIARRLGISARRNAPLFQKIITNRTYAGNLVLAIRARNFNRVEQLIQQVVPQAAVSVGAGFESDINFTSPTQSFGFGIFRPGQTIRTPQIRQVARIMQPIILRLAASRCFRLLVVKLYLGNKQAALLRLLRAVSGSRRLESVGIDEFGFFAVVRLSNNVRYNAIFSIQV